MNPTSPAATVLDEVATWAGITTQPTPRGATAIVFEGHELGHVHANRGTLDFPSPPTAARKCSKQDARRNGSPAGSPSNSRAAQMRSTEWHCCAKATTPCTRCSRSPKRAIHDGPVRG
jgi:hypothetical protein